MLYKGMLDVEYIEGMLHIENEYMY